MARSNRTAIRIDPRFPQRLMVVYGLAVLGQGVSDLVSLARSATVTVQVAAQEGASAVDVAGGVIETERLFPLTVAMASVSPLAVGLVTGERVVATLLLLAVVWAVRRLLVTVRTEGPFEPRVRRLLSWTVVLGAAWALVPRGVGVLAGNTVGGDLGLDLGGELDQTTVYVVVAGLVLAAAVDQVLRQAESLQQDAEGLV